MEFTPLGGQLKPPQVSSSTIFAILGVFFLRGSVFKVDFLRISQFCHSGFCICTLTSIQIKNHRKYTLQVWIHVTATCKIIHLALRHLGLLATGNSLSSWRFPVLILPPCTIQDLTLLLQQALLSSTNLDKAANLDVNVESYPLG